MKRILTYAELPARLRADALAKLNSLALLRARDSGQVMPYAWAERVAPLCRFTMTSQQRAVWDVNPLPWLQRRGIFSVFGIAPLPFDQINLNP
jgi:hypothetical protein